MSVSEVAAFLGNVYPAALRSAAIEEIEEGRALLRLRVGAADLRPGGTVSGPALMTLADLSVYCLVLASIGPVALAVTTSLSIDFLRKPGAGADVLAEAELLKLGSRLAVARVSMHSDGEPGQPVAHATVTYSLPPS